MKNFMSICATLLLTATLGFAQGTADQSASGDNNRASGPTTATRNEKPNPRGHDIGWIGLLGLLGLAGLRRRHSDVVYQGERETRGTHRAA